MKKRLLPLILALVLCLGLAIPAFAADTASVTAAGISFDAIVTGQYETYRASLEDSVAKGYTWAPAMLEKFGEAAQYEYHLGLINYGEEDDGVRDFWAYLVQDDVALDFHLEAGELCTIAGYSFSIGETAIEGETTYVATLIESITFPVPEGGVVDKDVIEKYLPGSDYLYCYRGDFNPNLNPDEAIDLVFADENGVPRTSDTPSTPTNTPSTPATPSTDFTDVAADAYYAAPVAWAVEKEITSGTGNNKFSPSQDCTNAQILTFIWRAYGKPEPTIDNPFINSVPDAYVKAAIWAYEKGMVSGTTFDTDKPCTRAMAATYLWQAAGSPTAPAASFTDVPADAAYAQAVAWAVEQKITAGTSTTTFSPDDVCNRGQIVTFLHRNLA